MQLADNYNLDDKTQTLTVSASYQVTWFDTRWVWRKDIYLMLIGVSLGNGEVVFCSQREDKLRLPGVKYEEIWKENQI